MIRNCVCEHAYQDSVYGKGMRVYNQTMQGHRCTVCSRQIIKNNVITPVKEIAGRNKK